MKKTYVNNMGGLATVKKYCHGYKGLKIADFKTCLTDTDTTIGVYAHVMEALIHGHDLMLY